MRQDLKIGIGAAMACVVGAAWFGSAMAQDSKEPDLSKGSHGVPMDPDKQRELQEYMMSSMGPCEEHDRLKGMEGRWRQTVTYQMDPAQPATTIEGEGTGAMILGGRFLESKSQGSFMGMPFESFSIVGYDRRHEHYTFVGFDTMGTYYVAAEGNWDEETQSIRMRGETHDPKIKSTEKYTMVYKPVNADEYVWEVWFDMPDGSEMRIVHVRNVRAE